MTNWNSRPERRRGAACLLALALCLALALPHAALAHGPRQAAGPQYIVEAGDTLIAIAGRFGVTVDALLQANPGINPNALSIGQALIIPGFESDGRALQFHALGLGETLESVARGYHTPAAELARLNRVVNPRAAYLGLPLAYSLESAGEAPGAPTRLHVLAPSGGLPVLAAQAGLGPWALAELNGLPGPAFALPGLQVIAPLREGEAAAGGLPAPFTSVRISPETAIQGLTLTVTVETATPAEITGTLSQFGALPPPPEWSPHACLYPTRTLHFAQQGEAAVALQGTCALAPLGAYELSLTATDAAGNAASFSQLLPLREGNYGREALTVPSATLDPTTIQREVDAIRAVATGFTPERMWQGPFQKPSEFGEFRSYFGTRRSYNDGPYDSFHTGLDYSGQVGTPILAPAPGVVVLAEPGFVVYGGVTFIDHGWGVYTGYLHQSQLNVAVGDRVETGQVIGLVGNTGRVTGPHLHWEIWVGGVTVDPLEWLAREFP